MATITQIKKWTFETAGNYTLAGDATVASGNLSMTDPVEQLPWATAWNNVPADDGNGDAVLANGTTYQAAPSGGRLGDGVLVYWAKRTTMATGKKFAARMRGADLYAQVVDGTGAQILRNDGSVGASSAEWEADWPEDETWLEHKVKVIGTVLRFSIDSPRHIEDSATGSVDTGDPALLQDDPNNPVTVGGGGAQAQPYLAYRRTGSCSLVVGQAWTIPHGTESLGDLSYVADLLGGGTEQLTLNLQYKVTGGTGDSDTWTDCPAAGDISSETFTAGTSTVLFRFHTAASLGLDNQNDPAYVPTVYAVLLSYEQATPDTSTGGQLKDVLKNIKAVLNADATLMAYDGWSGAYVGWPDTMDFQFYKSCGCVIEWVNTPEEDQSNAREAGLLVWGKDESHSIRVRVAMRPARTLEHSITGDGQLLDLTEDVLTVLRCETLSDTVARVKVASREPSAEALESGGAPGESEDFLLMIDIEVEVQGKLITAVRP